jgi:hypothetical protein
MWSTCSLLARAGITCYSFHAVCITADRIGLTAAAVQERAQPSLHAVTHPITVALSLMNNDVGNATYFRDPFSLFLTLLS